VAGNEAEAVGSGILAAHKDFVGADTEREAVDLGVHDRWVDSDL
jgi:hypothetical protein